MHIQTPEHITDPIFSGYLEASGGTLRATEQTSAEIGRPEWWFASDVIGEAFKPPQGDETHLLLRFAYSLTPPKNHEIEDATLSVGFSCDGPTAQPVVFDLFPQEVLEESKTDLKLSVKPTLKMKEAEASLVSLEASISVPKVEPIVTTAGLGGAKLSWHYRKHKRHPLIGTRMTYAIVGYPSAAERMSIQVGLTANVSGKFGFGLVKIPSVAEAKLLRTIP
jgi:hypothetical protein